MKNEIFYRHNMANNRTSHIIPMIIENLNKRGNQLTANSLTIYWKNAEFDNSSKPTVVIECLEDNINPTIMKTITIDSSDNSSDVLTLVITQVFKFIRVKYNSGSAISGTIGIALNYR